MASQNCSRYTMNRTSRGSRRFCVFYLEFQLYYSMNTFVFFYQNHLYKVLKTISYIKCIRYQLVDCLKLKILNVYRYKQIR